MGDHRYLGDTESALLRELATSASASHTRRSLSHRFGEVFSRHFDLKSFEMGWLESSGSSTASVFAFERGPDVRESVRDLRGADMRQVIQEGRPVFTARREVLTVPLIDSENPPGYAQVSFRSSPSEGALSERGIEMLGRILLFAQCHCRLVERIAKLAASAHQETQDLREELRKYQDTDPIVARSESMRRVIESADLVARHDTAVLIRGESGTGKELIARRIHRLSKRARQPFISVNCGALPETLIESELFGHEKGAFTGAFGRYRGRFERADKGTIFLDEIAELPQAVQVKLLRVLQEGEFERLGGEESIRVNVRVIAATHQSLETMIEQGKFRADLFYRINVFPIMIPPLRDRKEDIPILAQTLLAESAKRLGCPLPPLRRKGIAQLLSHAWLGNVRELANELERALIMAQGRELNFSGLAPDTAKVSNQRELSTETLDEGLRRTIQKALETCHGRIYGKQGAAARLGIPPSTLQGKMRKLGMNRQHV